LPAPDPRYAKLAGLVGPQETAPSPAHLALAQAMAPSLDEKTQGMFGFDPSIVKRGAILPLGMDAEGNTSLAWPQFAYDLARSFMLPGHVAEGGEWSEADARRMALDFGLAGGGAGAATAPRGALAMGAGRHGSFSLDYFGQPVRILQNPSTQEIIGFLGRTKYKAARRLIDEDSGDVFIWDAADPALHELVAKEIGIRPKTADMIAID